MNLLFLNYNLEAYGKFSSFHLADDASIEDISIYAEQGLGKQWSEYAILCMSPDGVPYVVNTIHRQGALRKHIIINKRKNKCSNNTTPPSDLSLSVPPSPSTQHLVATSSAWQNVSTAPLPSTSAETPLYESFSNNVNTQQEAELF